MIVVRSLNVFFISVGLLAATLLFVRRLERKKLWWLKYLISVAVMFGVCILLSYIKNLILSSIPVSNVEGGSIFFITYFINVVMYCLIFVLGIITVWFVYKTDVSEALFIGSAAYALQSVSMGIYSVIMKLSDLDYQFNIQDILSYPWSASIFLLCYVAVFLSAYFIYIRKYEIEGDLSDKMWVYLIIVTIVNIFMGSANIPPSDNVVADRLFMILLFSRILLCVGGLMIQFSLSEHYRLYKSKIALQHVMEQQKLQFEIEKENIDTVNINAHDLRKQIKLILQSSKMAESGKIEASVREIEEKLDIVDYSYHTGNKALDVTLAEKSRDCKNKNIKISVMADGGSLGRMDDLDIYVLFGNILDNAIEAAEQVADPEGRIISMTVSGSYGCVSVHSENTFSTEPKFVGGDPITTKTDKRFHGFGIKSIKNVVRKYGGKTVIKINHDMFCMDLLLFP